MLLPQKARDSWNSIDVNSKAIILGLSGKYSPVSGPASRPGISDRGSRKSPHDTPSHRKISLHDLSAHDYLSSLTLYSLGDDDHPGDPNEQPLALLVNATKQNKGNATSPRVTINDHLAP